MRRFGKIALAGMLLAMGGGAALLAQEAQDEEEMARERGPVEALADPDRFIYEDGEALYRASCQGCHMPEGEGAVGAAAYPPLAGNETLENAAYPIFVVLHGQRAMPAFGGQMDDEQIAAVVEFIRTSFGNEFEESVSPDDVAAFR